LNTSSPQQHPLATRRIWRWSLPLLLFLAPWGIRQAIPAGDGLNARYFRSLRSDGPPALTVVDREPSVQLIRRRWGTEIPSTFSVTWRGYLTVPAADTYELATTSDDGSQVYVDDRLVVDNAGTHSQQTRSGTARLTSGSHRVMLVYTQEGGDLHLEWTWRRDAAGASTIPSWLLSRRTTTYPVALAARVLDLMLLPAGLLALASTLAGCVLWLRAWRPGWARRLAACEHDIPFYPFHYCVREGLRMRVARLTLPAPAFLSERVSRLLVRVVAAVALMLPVALVASALAFWGHGVIDEEATTFVINYLSNRPFLQSILDPNLNDWGSFQARELAYVFDRMDARVFARLMVDWHVLLFTPLSSLLCLTAIVTVYLAGARRVVRLDRTTSLLILSLFLSCIVTQASTPVLYRSSKMLLSVAALAFLFRLVFLTTAARAFTLRNGIGLFTLGVLMSMCDRQGYAFLLATTTVLAFLWARDRIHGSESAAAPPPYGAATVATAAATGAAILYNNVLAPNAILWANGYWPDLSYEDIPFERFNALLAQNAWQMFRGQISFFFGNLPFWSVMLLGVVAWIAVIVRRPLRKAGVWRTMTSTGIVVTAAIAGALLVLITVMGMRHPPVFRIVDHAYWYYTLSMQAVLLFAVTLAAAQLLEGGSRQLRGYLWALLLAMIASNVAHYPAQRRLMEASGEWFGKQHAFAQLYARAFAADERQAPESERVLPSWLRVHGTAAEVHLPVHAYGLLDAFRAGYATLRERPPLVDAGGPYWRELRNFLDGSASPFLEPGSTADGLAALQSVGIRKLVIHRADLQPPATVDAIVGAARTLGPLVERVSDRDDLVAIDFADTRRPRVDKDDWQAVPASAFTLTASEASAEASHAADGDIATEWNSVARQGGTEWLSIAFDRPRSLAGVRLTVTDQALDRYPRRLRIESQGPDGTRTLYDDGTLRLLAFGLLTDPVDAPIEIPFSPNRTATLVIRQTGDSPSWSWAVRELTVYEH
jgi:hypothetical protein